MALAQHIDGAEIVCADSRQVYRGMDIGTAKPTPEEQAAAPHHGLDLADPDEPFTASDYQRAALEALTSIGERRGVALLVGGTGLYLRAIARGLPLDQGDTDPEVRATLNERHLQDGLEPLVGELRERDSAVADGIDLRNPRRVIRALERAIVTGSAAPPQPLGYAAPVTWLGLTCPPEEHRRAEAFDVLAGRTDVEAAKATDARRTWAYARRQRTWFRSEPGVEWLEAGDGGTGAALRIASGFLKAIDRDGYAGQR